MVLTVSFALSPVTSSFLPPSPRGLQAHPTPGWADIASARLDTSNGCQDHATSPSAAAPFVCAPADRSRKNRPAITSRAPTLPRPPHPALHVRDDRDTPLCTRRDTGINNAVSTKRRSEIFFARGLDTCFARSAFDLPDGQFDAICCTGARYELLPRRLFANADSASASCLAVSGGGNGILR